MEVHGGHGYLIQQFLAAESNKRSDRFGGATVAERSRFGCEVIEAIRQAAPEMTVVVRINGSDLVPDGLQAADAVVAAQRFAEAGADAFVVSAGVYGSVPWTIPLLDDPEGAFLELAAEVRRSVEVPVIGVGRITTPESAESALRGGRCDAVGLGRALLADEDWVAKALQGRSGQIRPCIATVEGCAGRLQYGEAISCSVNPGVGRETHRPLERAEVPGPVLVVGGGPAGMEAARRAAAARSRRASGGAGRPARRRSEPGGGHSGLGPSWRAWQAWYEGELERLGVTVSLGRELDGAGDLAGFPADHLVLATGARTAPEVLDGYEYLPAWTLEDLLEGRASSHGGWHLIDPVVVLGGGSRALAAALWCRRGGYRVALLSAERVGHDTSGLARRAYLTRLANNRGPGTGHPHHRGRRGVARRGRRPEGAAGAQHRRGRTSAPGGTGGSGASGRPRRPQRRRRSHRAHRRRPLAAHHRRRHRRGPASGGGATRPHRLNARHTAAHRGARQALPCPSVVRGAPRRRPRDAPGISASESPGAVPAGRRRRTAGSGPSP